MDKYNPSANPAEGSNVTGYANAFSMAHVLRACGNDLTRENVMRQAASLKDVEVPMLLPGIRMNTSATDFYPLQSVNMARIEGEGWKLFGEMISADPVTGKS
jgi:branched-chain amino acid transport system substrate-binding protein